MSQISIRITTLSPVLLAAGPPGGNLIETLTFIPGNTVRGVIANRYISQGGDAESSEFARLFLSGEVRYGFAYPSGTFPVPQTARTCKYDGGFRADGGHGITDLACSGSAEQRCAVCDSPLDYFEGFYNPVSGSEQGILTRLITRNAIDPVRGTAGHGRLYSQRVIEENQAFSSTIEAPADIAPVFAQLLSTPFPAGIGTGRSRGQGWVEVSEEKVSTSYAWGAAKERYAAAIPRKLMLTLLSDAIFQDDYLRDCFAPEISHLQPFGIGLKDWKPVPSYAGHRLVYGFDGPPLRLPRQPRLAVTAGSVFFFDAAVENPTIPDGEGIQWIGENNAEGYGLAILWHPFHNAPGKEAAQ
jgi:RAMP superfamily